MLQSVPFHLPLCFTFDTQFSAHSNSIVRNWIVIIFMASFLYLSVFSQDKYERHTSPTALIMMLTQVEDMIPVHDHLYDSTPMTDRSNVTQCVDPQRFVFSFSEENTHCHREKCMCFGIIRKTHSMSNFGVFVVLSDIRSMTEDCSKNLFLFLGFCELYC